AALDAVEGALDAEALAGGELAHDAHGIADGSQRIAQLMADRAGDLAERRQPLVARELVLRFAELLGGLLEGADEVADPVRGAVLALHGGEIAVAHPDSRLPQALDRPGDAVRRQHRHREGDDNGKDDAADGDAAEVADTGVKRAGGGPE